MTSAASASKLREPKYYQVKRHLLVIIDAQTPGSPVPTERVLTTELGTSRTTVRQALSELVAEGRLVRRQGCGTFVAEPKIAWPLQLTSFTAQAAANGFLASATLLDAARLAANSGVADRLGLVAGAPVYRLERLRLADGIPMALETSHLSALRFPGLIARIRHTPSLYRVLAERYQVIPTAAEETIETAPATPRQAELLDTDTGSPMLVLARHSFDDAGRPVEWVQSWYRGDRYSFVAHLAQR
ncbi:MAG: GntR family transcriptional regulator [Actinomycetota bacterium]|nr:GntR family transcriptional regulator [Actinomycetota bacterium]MDQ2955482.1 GntR family transcriptional regulator [Actinomycetota bacterium]